MKLKEKQKLYKKCPRCGNKVLSAQTKCEECGLLFSRLEFASNKAAKKKLRKFDRDFIIYTTQYPKDVSKVKLILLTLFLGLFGGHYFYVGKYFKGLFMILGFIFTLLCTIFNSYLVDVVESMYLFVPVGIYGLSWVISLVFVLSMKFKVPVIVDMPELKADEVVEVKNIQTEKEKMEKEASKSKKNQKKVENFEKTDKKEEE